MNKENEKIVKLINLTLSHFQIITSEIEFVSSQKNLQQCLNKFAFCTKSNWTLHIGGVRTALFNYLFAKKQWCFLPEE
jgi:hypothetical protein